MKYNEIELEPIDKIQVFEEPRELICWNDEHEVNGDEPEIMNVHSIYNYYNEQTRVLASRAVRQGVDFYDYCAEIPKPKTRKMNSLEVMEYLHKLQLYIDIGDKTMDNKPKTITYSTHYRGLIVCHTGDDLWFGADRFHLRSVVKGHNFGILKNGKVTEFKIPEVEETE